MRLYRINKAKEGGHDRMQNNYLVINSTIVDYMICSFIILSSFIDTFFHDICVLSGFGDSQARQGSY